MLLEVSREEQEEIRLAEDRAASHKVYGDGVRETFGGIRLLDTMGELESGLVGTLLRRCLPDSLVIEEMARYLDERKKDSNFLKYGGEKDLRVFELVWTQSIWPMVRCPLCPLTWSPVAVLRMQTAP